jgi:hypothetical protein
MWLVKVNNTVGSRRDSWSPWDLAGALRAGELVEVVEETCVAALKDGTEGHVVSDEAVALCVLGVA